MDGPEVKVEKQFDDEDEKVNGEAELFLEAPIKIEYPVEPFEFQSCANLEELSPLPNVSHNFGSGFPIKHEEGEGDEQFLNKKIQFIDGPSTSTHLLSLQPENSAHGDIPALEVIEENSQYQVNQRSPKAQRRPRKSTHEVSYSASELELDFSTGANPVAQNTLEKIISGIRDGRKTGNSAHIDAQNNLDSQLVEGDKKKTGSAPAQNNSATEERFSDGESGDEFEVGEGLRNINALRNQTAFECLRTCPCQVCHALKNFHSAVTKTFLRTMLGIFSGDAPQVELTKNSGVYIPVAVKNKIKRDFHQQPSKMAMEILFALYGEEVFRTLQVTARGNKCGTYGMEPHVLAAVLGKGNRLTGTWNVNFQSGRIVKDKGKSAPSTRSTGGRLREEGNTIIFSGNTEQNRHEPGNSAEGEISGAEPQFVWPDSEEYREPGDDPLGCDSQHSNEQLQATSEVHAEKSATRNGEEHKKKRTQTKDKRHACPHCDKKFAHSSILSEHVRMHTGEKPYACSFCNKTFSRNSNLSRHVLMHAGQATGKPYACSYCEEKFAQKGDLTEHIRTHTGEKLKGCPYCEKSFPNSTALSEHVRTHSGAKPYSCPHCDGKFSDQTELRLHIQTHRENPHTCPECNQKFDKKSHLSDHIKTHIGEKPYACQHCDKKFSHPSILTEHIRMHTGEKPYSCPLCYRKFSRNSNLSRHLQVHTDRSKEKLYDCLHCDKKFTRKGLLFEHNRMHNREKPLNCPHCGKSFSQSSALSQHVRTHSKKKELYSCRHCDEKFSSGPSFRSHLLLHVEKPFACPTCGIKFVRKSELAGHARTHAGESSYSCPHCNEEFQFGYSLRLHIKSHHGEVPRPGVAMGIYMRSVVM